ncbi:hypothetical protein QBC32DRAFT_353326 [Pseudoneurospora amorphoporcata]|uniref:Uncharacterized protein n=1 Tax=Pseudoneurospora amorphoporcata TaxID=241081 RepID=A0AAN6NL26_9PEZI|nr:hypothetical protein QBC32DRAFT_353326 [Pseudoneurospora amorphoporcata]
MQVVHTRQASKGMREVGGNAGMWEMWECGNCLDQIRRSAVGGRTYMVLCSSNLVHFIQHSNRRARRGWLARIPLMGLIAWPLPLRKWGCLVSFLIVRIPAAQLSVCQLALGLVYVGVCAVFYLDYTCTSNPLFWSVISAFQTSNSSFLKRHFMEGGPTSTSTSNPISLVSAFHGRGPDMTANGIFFSV